MKKKIEKHIICVCVSVVTLLMLSSCEMFTTSWGKNSVRDQPEVFADFSASDLAKMASSIEFANPETAKAIMEALAKKKNDLTGLNKEEKEAILDLALDTTLPMSSLMDIAKDLLKNLGSSSDENIGGDDAKEMLTEIFDAVNSFDTTAVTTLLTDKTTLQTADPSTLANAAIATLAQVAKSLGPLGSDLFMGTGSGLADVTIDFKTQTPDKIVEELLKNAGVLGIDSAIVDENKDNLTAAITVLKLLSTGKVDLDGDDVTREDLDDVKLLGIVSLDDILGGLGGGTQ